MIRGFRRTLCTARTIRNIPRLVRFASSSAKTNTTISHNQAHGTKTDEASANASNSPHIKKDKPSIVHENGLYFGKFTKEEYDSAKAFVTSQYTKLEQEIKGSHDVRENLGKIPQFPPSSGTSKSSVRRPSAVNSLLDLFQETIKTTGPISLLAYMRQCLTHPELGYYTTRDPLDASGGDFITSPEISSVFGEMIGIWLYAVWTSQGQPLNVNFVEFGPGRGTLMLDVTRVFSRFVKKTRKSIDVKIWLIESSPVLRQEQRKALCPAERVFETDATGSNTSVTKWGHPVTWVDMEKDVQCSSGECNYVLAHEFFDALPIKSFTRTEKGWRELLVEHTPSVINTQKTLPAAAEKELETGDSTPPELETEFHLTASIKETSSSMVPRMSSRFANFPVGSRIEVCADSELYMSRIMELVNNKGKGQGAALIIDYGPADEVPLNSLRGIYKHKFVSPFFRPGEVDLSVDVDFGNLKLLAQKNVDVFGPVKQGDWLHTMGAGHRFDLLIKAANLTANKELLFKSYLRLTEEDEMGKIYNFLALMPQNSAAPVGFGGSL